MTDLEARLEDLEVRSAHQEKTISDLNDALAGQWRRIELLERIVAQLREEVRNAQPQREGEEPPPPLY